MTTLTKSRGSYSQWQISKRSSITLYTNTNTNVNLVFNAGFLSLLIMIKQTPIPPGCTSNWTSYNFKMPTHYKKSYDSIVNLIGANKSNSIIKCHKWFHMFLYLHALPIVRTRVARKMFLLLVCWWLAYRNNCSYNNCWFHLQTPWYITNFMNSYLLSTWYILQKEDKLANIAGEFYTSILHYSCTDTCDFHNTMSCDFFQPLRIQTTHETHCS